MVGKFAAQSSQYLIDGGASVSAKEDGVAIFSAEARFYFAKFCLGQEFGNRTFRLAGFVADVSQTTSAFAFGNFSKAVDLLAAE